MNTKKELCPVCEAGMLHIEEVALPVTYKSSTTTVSGFIHSVCDSCGAEVADYEATKHNKRLVISHQKSIDGLLTGEEVNLILKKLNITQSKASSIFGGGPVAFSKYINNEVTQSEAMDKLLRVSFNVPEALEFLATLAKVEIQSSLHFSFKKEVFRNTYKGEFSVETESSPKFGKWKKHPVHIINDSNYSSYDTQSAAA